MDKMIDVHIHLTHEKYDNIDEIIQTSKQEGIKNVLLIACDKKEIIKSIKLQKSYKDFMKIAIGYHPMEVSKINANDIKDLEEKFLSNDSIIAIGEIGLDYHWYPEEKEIQKKIFKEQLKLAKKLSVPFIVHCREAVEDTYQIIKEVGYYNGIMHSFAENYENAKRFIDLGMYISISGPLTFKNGHNQKDVVKNIDINKLLVETDGPFLTPVPHRGETNYPYYVKYILEEISSIRDIEIKELKKIILKNTYEVLKEFND